MAYVDEVLADSPLAYYRLSEASGTAMADSSGNGRGGTYEGGPILGASGLLVGDPDTAVDFDGASTRGVVAQSAWMDVSLFTFEALCRADSLTGNRVLMARHNPEVSHTWAMLRLDSGKPTLYLYRVGWKACQSPEALAPGTTYHVAGTYDGSDMRVYVNGVLKATFATPSAPVASSAPLTVGANWGGVSLETFDGIIDEAAFYGAALSGARLVAHYDAAATVPPLAASLVGEAGLVPQLWAKRYASASLAGEATLVANLAALRTFETSSVYANDGYNYAGVGTVDYDPPIAATPARVRRSKVQRVHQSLPAPTLENGRPV